MNIEEIERKLHYIEYYEGIGAHLTIKECLILLSHISTLEEKVKGLENERDGFKNGQIQLQNIVSNLMDTNSKWAEKVKGLEPDALYLRKWREIRGSNPEVPCACVIDENGNWLKKCEFHKGIFDTLESRIKVLEEVVEKHKKLMIKLKEDSGYECMREIQDANEELYKVVEGMKNEI